MRSLTENYIPIGKVKEYHDEEVEKPKTEEQKQKSDNQEELKKNDEEELKKNVEPESTNSGVKVDDLLNTEEMENLVAEQVENIANKNLI